VFLAFATTKYINKKFPKFWLVSILAYVEQLREYCLLKPEVEEGFPFGKDTLVYKVKNKIFVLFALQRQPLQFNVKCDPEKAIELREQYSCIIPGYHMNKKYWNTIIVDGTLTFQQLKSFIDHSYELVNTKTKRPN
jgi:predicted DNA-binding protein (MmcQ/YjbR family)